MCDLTTAIEVTCHMMTNKKVHTTCSFNQNRKEGFLNPPNREADPLPFVTDQATLQFPHPHSIRHVEHGGGTYFRRQHP